MMPDTERPEKPAEPGPDATAEEWNRHRHDMVAWHDWTAPPEDPDDDDDDDDDGEEDEDEAA